MTASQVIDEIKVMSPEDRGRVMEFLQKFQEASAAQKVDDETVRKIVEGIMDRHAPLMRKLAS